MKSPGTDKKRVALLRLMKDGRYGKGGPRPKLYARML